MSDDALPFATPDLPGVSGRIRERPEDFRVDELPLYEPCGEGEHLYVRIEKRGRPTLGVVGAMARALSIPVGRIGYAGLKDAHAVTTQTVSIHGVDERDVLALNVPGVRIEAVSRHRNKLRRGHLRGNRFRVILRGVVPDAVPRARSVIDALTRDGVPNYFGPQRFGNHGQSDRLGRAVLLRDAEAFVRELVAPYSEAAERVRAGDLRGAADRVRGEARDEARILDAVAAGGGRLDRVFRAVPKNLRRLYLSALQSRLFNELLARRIERRGVIETGDLAWIHRNGACFLVDDADACAARAADFEISPTGPLFGSRAARPAGEVARREAACLERHGLDAGSFDRRDLSGARRPLRVPLGGARVDPVRGGAIEDGGLRLEFELPPGAYATVVLGEVSKLDG